MQKGMEQYANQEQTEEQKERFREMMKGEIIAKKEAHEPR